MLRALLMFWTAVSSWNTNFQWHGLTTLTHLIRAAKLENKHWFSFDPRENRCCPSLCNAPQTWLSFILHIQGQVWDISSFCGKLRSSWSQSAVFWNLNFWEKNSLNAGKSSSGGEMTDISILETAKWSNSEVTMSWIHLELLCWPSVLLEAWSCKLEEASPDLTSFARAVLLCVIPIYCFLFVTLCVCLPTKHGGRNVIHDGEYFTVCSVTMSLLFPLRFPCCCTLLHKLSYHIRGCSALEVN